MPRPHLEIPSMSLLPSSKRGNAHASVRRGKRLWLGQSPLVMESLEDRLVLAASYSTVNDWGSGLQGQIAITNDQAATISNWRLEFDYARDISNIWDAQIISHVGTHYVVGSASYNSTIAVGQTVSFGFTA